MAEAHQVAELVNTLVPQAKEVARAPENVATTERLRETASTLQKAIFEIGGESLRHAAFSRVLQAGKGTF